MKKFENKIDQIENYLEGALSEEEKNEFEASLSGDKELQKMMKGYRTLLDGIKYAGRNDLVEKIQQWESEMPGNFEAGGHAAKERNFYRYFIAAVVVFFLVTTAVVYNRLDNSYQRIVADYYTPYDILPETSRGAKADENSFDHIYRVYDQKRYEETIDLINRMDVASRTDHSKYVLANAYQATGRFDEAVEIYKDLVSSDNIYKSGAQWYLALCYLSKENKDLAVPLLEDLSDSNTSKSSKARAILKEIN